MQNKTIVATHANDPRWIISLWLAIHGGDPAPDVHGNIPAAKVNAAAAAAIGALAAHLDPAKQKAVMAAMGH